MNNLESKLKFLESELKDLDNGFKNRGNSYNPYFALGYAISLLQIAINDIKSIKKELEK